MTETAEAPATVRVAAARTSRGRPGPLVTMRRHLWVTVLTVLVGTAAGVGAALVQGNSFTAESRLAVGGNTLTAETIPGFALAADELAGDYARYVSSTDARASLLGPLGASASEVTDISASPVPDTSVVMVDVSAKTRSSALAAATVIANNLSKEVDAIVSISTPAATLITLQTLIQAVTAQQNLVTADRLAVASATGAHLVSAKNTLDADNNTLQSMEIQQIALSSKYESLVENPNQSGTLDVTQPAQITRNALHSRIELYGLIGFGAGSLLALLLAALIEQRKGRHSLSQASVRRVTA